MDSPGFPDFFYRLLWESNQISRYESLKEKSIHNQMSSRFHDPKQFPLLHEKNRFCFVFLPIGG